MTRYNYFLQNQDDEIFSPIDESIIRVKLAELDPCNGSFIVLQNKLKVGEFFQCMASDETNYLCEVKIGDKLYQHKLVHSLHDTLQMINSFIEVQLRITKDWKEIIL